MVTRPAVVIWLAFLPHVCTPLELTARGAICAHMQLEEGSRHESHSSIEVEDPCVVELAAVGASQADFGSLVDAPSSGLTYRLGNASMTCCSRRRSSSLLRWHIVLHTHPTSREFPAGCRHNAPRRTMSPVKSA